MKLIVGLGNPGRLYIDSRHNIGFSVIKSLAKDCKIALEKDSGVSCLSGKAKFGGENVILAMPLTYMNLSGTAVKALLKKHKIDLSSVLVVCDDLYLELGRIRIRLSGSSGGHRGLDSIMDSLESRQFCRLRIGINRPRKDTEASEYVLSPFNKTEKAKVKGIIERATQCCRVWALEGIARSMNIFNKRSQE